MRWALEVVVVPVSDVDRAKGFYAERVGFEVDFDTVLDDTTRLVQLTPPGSGCSISIGTVRPSTGGIDMPPGSVQHLQLVVPNLRLARAELLKRGVDVSEIRVYDAGALRTAHGGDDLDKVGFLFFDDPDGNGWVVQQISADSR